MAARNPLTAIRPIDDDARIHAWGEVWRLVKTTKRGHKLKQLHNLGATLFITHEEYNAESLRSDFRYEEEYFRPSCVVERARRHRFLSRTYQKKIRTMLGSKLSASKNSIEFIMQEYYRLPAMDTNALRN